MEEKELMENLNEAGLEVNEDGCLVEQKQHPVKDWCVAHGKLIAGVLCGAAGIALGVVGTLLVGSLGDDESKDSGDNEDESDDATDVEVTEF